MKRTIEAEAYDAGWAEGAAYATLKTAKALNAAPAAAMELLQAHLDGDEAKAKQALDAYLKDQP